jgi:hypothetical protein
MVSDTKAISNSRFSLRCGFTFAPSLKEPAFHGLAQPNNNRLNFQNYNLDIFEFEYQAQTTNKPYAHKMKNQNQLSPSPNPSKPPPPHMHRNPRDPNHIANSSNDWHSQFDYGYGVTWECFDTQCWCQSDIKVCRCKIETALCMKNAVSVGAFCDNCKVSTTSSL